MGTPDLSAFAIYQAVIIEAFLWGLGTAIGELPPYYVARAGKHYILWIKFILTNFIIASLAGKKSEEFEEILDEVNTD